MEQESLGDICFVSYSAVWFKRGVMRKKEKYRISRGISEINGTKTANGKERNKEEMRQGIKNV